MSVYIAIVMWILAVEFGVFILPLVVKFSNVEILDYVIRKCCWIIGLILLSFTSAMLATMAETEGLALVNEIFTFMYLINWLVYIMVTMLGVSMLFKYVQYLNYKKAERTNEEL